jgi:hypothetical protein
MGFGGEEGGRGLIARHDFPAGNETSARGLVEWATRKAEEERLAGTPASARGSARLAEPPPVYCVSLDTSADRRARIRRRFGHHSMLERLTFVEAVRTTAVRDWSQWWQHRAASACFASHLKAMAMALDNRAASQGAIICEDDVLLHNEFSERLAEVLANLPPDAKLCSLGWFVHRPDTVLPWDGKQPEQRNLCRIVPWAVWGAHCYWISPRYAAELLDRYGDRAVDAMPHIVETIAFESGGYVSNPPLALQDEIDSSIRHRRGVDRFLEPQELWPYSDYSDCEQGHDHSPLARRATGQRPSIAACMVVRDEGQELRSSIQSVRALIDTWMICDAGSRDNTAELVERMLRDIPGELHRSPWRDAGWNRSELLALAQGAADYLLLLDPGMTVEWRGLVPGLDRDCYALATDGDLPSGRKPLLLRGDRRWWFEGHRLRGEARWSEGTLEAFRVRNERDAEAHVERLRGRVVALEQELASNPPDPSATFEFAQASRGLGEDRRAIELYESRARLEGDAEERFYAALQAGAMRARRNDDAAVGALLRAWELQPQRAEPLYELARFCRFRSWPQAACLFAERGLALACPEDAPAASRWMYEWGLRVEFAMAAYWLGETELSSCETLLADGRIPEDVRQGLLELRSHCLTRDPAARPAPRKQPRLETIAPSFRPAELRLEVRPAWPPASPTIACDGDGYRMIVPTVNRRQDGEQESFTDDAVVHTLNYLVRLDGNFEVLDVHPLRDRSVLPARHPTGFEGYEGCKLFSISERWYAAAAVRDRNPRGRSEMVLLELDDDEITAVTRLRTPLVNEQERDWMPFVADGGLWFLSSCSPTVVLGCVIETGLCHVVENHRGWEEAALGGGSQGVELDDGFLFVVPEASGSSPAWPNAHRFVLLDRHGGLTASSPRFTFLESGSERCAGLARRDEKLILGFGSDGGPAMVGMVDTAEVLALIVRKETLQPP